MGEIPLHRIDAFRVEIPRTYNPAMRTEALLFADEKMVEVIRHDESPKQAANVATMPGIVGKAMAMPDIHQGYGFPIGGVAAFDLDEGVISPGGIGYDVNCLSGDSRILTAHGYRLPIAEFAPARLRTPLASLNPSHRTTATDIAAFMRFRADRAYRVRTTTGVEITATADHPFLTPKGMVPLREVGSLPVSIYPFRGVDYEEPAEKTLVTEADVARLLPASSRLQVIPQLRRRGLLPLTTRNPKFPYLLKLLGIVLGDGSAHLPPYVPQLSVYGKPEDLEDVSKDIARLGFRKPRLYRRHRHHLLKRRAGAYSFDFEETSIHIGSTSLVVLLHLLGLPVGNKAKQDFMLPAYLFELPLWMRRLFLAALFGAEMSTPREVPGAAYNLEAPAYSLCKRTGFEVTGRELANQVRRLIEDFGVRTYDVITDSVDVPNTGEASHRFRVVVASEKRNLVRFYSTVNFEYNQEKRLLANAAAYYLTLKEMLVRLKRKSGETARALRDTGHPRDSILAELAGLYVSPSFLRHRLDGRGGRPRAWPPFPTFPEFVDRVRASAGTSGHVWDRIVSVEEVPVDAVYDFSVTSEHHNFIADGFVVSNCGVRLIRTDLTEPEVRPKLKELVDALFTNVPSGVGSEGRVELSRPDLEHILSEGVQWAVDKGFGWPEDRDFTEARGCLPDADPSKISQRARARGIEQVGSLGAGNHFVEVQKVDRIHDATAAKALGIDRPGQIVVMVHTGSRGFGHQTATDYIQEHEAAVRKYGIQLPDRQLACAPFTSKEGQDYWKAMCCAANFAWTNRQMITHWTRESFQKVFGRDAENLGMRIVYDVCHNIGKVEEHTVEGRRMKVVVHRKGATRAFPAGHPETPAKYRSVGQPVLIPGDMGTCSYVLVGLPGSMERSFGSSCHGAGRLLSRAAATRKFRPNDVVRDLESKGIYIHASSKAGIVEEAPGAYKDVEHVVRIAEGAGLTKIVARVVPLGVVKG